MTIPVELFFDFRSPYSYLAFTQLRDLDVEIAFRPIKILTVMEKVGNVPTTITCAAKGRYARNDRKRWAHRFGVTLNASDMRRNDGEACARAVLAAKSPVEAAAITQALYRAMWSEGKALASTADIVAVLETIGQPLDEAEIDAPEIQARLDTNTEEAAARGVFGSPTIFVGEEMYFGNDRMDFVREEVTRLEAAA